MPTYIYGVYNILIQLHTKCTPVQLKATRTKSKRPGQLYNPIWSDIYLSSKQKE